jgi:acyl carrier protein
MDTNVESVQLRLQRVVAEQMCVAAAEVTMDKAVTDFKGGDSLDAVELVMAVEDVFGIGVPDTDALKLYPARLQEWLQYIEARLSAAKL